MDALNVALVGCGIFGEVHAQAYAESPASNLVAVCDRDEGRARGFAEKYGCRWYTDVAQLAADGEVQAVSVATPDFAHREVCIALLAAGKHVLVEKPLATSVADAEAIAAAARERPGLVAMVDFHNRYHPALRSVKDRLDAGEIGRPQMLYARLSDRIEVATKWFPWAGRSGPEWFLGSHLADVACWLFDGQATRVFAEGRKDVLAGRGIDCYDSMQIHLSFPAGFATLETSWILPDTFPMICDFHVSLQTTDTRVDWDLAHQGVTVIEPSRYDRPMLYGATSVGRETFGFFRYSIHDFVRAVLAGEKSPAPLEEGVANVRILAAALQSAQTGHPIDLT
jgi:predicted dehydrogenase